MKSFKKNSITFLKFVLNYQIDTLSFQKIETRRAQIINFSVLFECLILLINVVRHTIRKNYSSAMVVFSVSMFFLLLYFSKKIKRENKYVLYLLTGIFVTFIFILKIDHSLDIIQVYTIVMVASGLFLNGKRFYFIYSLSILFYYITFFYLNYISYYNPIGILPFIVFTLMIQLFIKDAQKNETIIENQIEKLQTLDKQKTKLFSNISHEIRTPLTLILGSNQQLSESKEKNIIDRNAKKLLELINQILDLAKIESKQRKINLENTSLQLFFNDIITNFEFYGQNKKINFEYTIDDKLTLFKNDIYFDKDALFKIVSNLLMNAFKFSAENDLVQLEVTIGKNNDLQIIISDTGKGITKEELPFIFNQFYHSNIGLEASSGIGLSLVKELIESLGGSITVTSVYEEGSSFTVCLPTKLHYFNSTQLPYNLVLEQKKMLTEENTTNQTIQNKTDKELVLLVEDNEELMTFVKEILEEDFTVITAADGEIGIEKAITFTPDLIVSDIMMPKVNGLELLTTLKNDIKTSHIPIILLTAKADIDDRLKGLELKADDYITKPFHKEELLLRIGNKLNFRNTIQNKNQNISNYKKEEIVSKEDKFLHTIQELVKLNLSDSNFGPEELSLKIGLSSSQIFRKIKALTNLSTSIYMRNIRLEESKYFLVNRTATISEIAYETGFSTPAYFGKCFKEYTGITPKEFLLKG